MILKFFEVTGFRKGFSLKKWKTCVVCLVCLTAAVYSTEAQEVSLQYRVQCNATFWAKITRIDFTRPRELKHGKTYSTSANTQHAEYSTVVPTSSILQHAELVFRSFASSFGSSWVIEAPLPSHTQYIMRICSACVQYGCIVYSTLCVQYAQHVFF